MSNSFKEIVFRLIKDKNIEGMEEFLKLNSFDRVLDIAKEFNCMNELEYILENMKSKGFIRYLREGEKIK